MSPLRCSGGFSTSMAGLIVIPHTFLARRKMPCGSATYLRRELGADRSEASHCSIVAVVIGSSGM